jgi:hypothetical protein
LQADTRLVVYGRAAFLLLGQQERTSLDIDVAGPYSQADYADLQQACRAAGLPVNSDDLPAGEHMVTGARLATLLAGSATANGAGVMAGT